MSKCRRLTVSLYALGTLMIHGLAHAQETKRDLSYGNWGFDLTAIDSSVSPGADFFGYANGAWLQRTAIPSDKSRITLRALMTDRTEAHLRALLEAAAQQTGQTPGDLSGKVGAFYKAFMAEDAIEAQGPGPIMPKMAAITAMSAREGVAAMMGRASYDFAGSFFGLYIDIDAKHPTQYVVSLNQGGLGLPDRDYYLKAGPKFVQVRTAYQAYVERLLTLVGWPAPLENAKQIVAMEIRIAEAHWSKAEARELDQTYNPMTVVELEAFAPGFPWRQYLAEAKLASAVRVVVAEKSAFPKIADIFAAAPLDTLLAWQAFHTANKAARYLSKSFADAHFEMYEKAILDQAEQQARWKRGIFAVSGDFNGTSDPLGHMSWAVGQLYVERHFSTATKDRVEILIGNLVRAFRARLEKRDWMSSATKAVALEKLDSLIIQVGFPNKPQRNYTRLIVRDDDPVGNVRRAAGLDWDFHVDRLPNPVDRNAWPCTPQVNNAFNMFYERNLTFPAAFMQAPIYDPNADHAVNYGALGAIVGHEITHSFDDQGRKIDAKGQLRDWWTGEEIKVFGARAAELGRQYSAFEALPGLHVNGQLTLGENIADLGGLTMALDAYHASLQGKPAPVIDGLTGDQRVFLGWAQAWRGKLSEAALRNLVTADPHAPRQYRVNGVVRNMDEWYTAFGVKPGDKLYLEPDRRVRIW